MLRKAVFPPLTGIMAGKLTDFEEVQSQARNPTIAEPPQPHCQAGRFRYPQAARKFNCNTVVSCLWTNEKPRRSRSLHLMLLGPRRFTSLCCCCCWTALSSPLSRQHTMRNESRFRARHPRPSGSQHSQPSQIRFLLRGHLFHHDRQPCPRMLQLPGLAFPVRHHALQVPATGPEIVHHEIRRHHEMHKPSTSEHLHRLY